MYHIAVIIFCVIIGTCCVYLVICFLQSAVQYCINNRSKTKIKKNNVRLISVDAKTEQIKKQKCIIICVLSKYNLTDVAPLVLEYTVMH